MRNLNLTKAVEECPRTHSLRPWIKLKGINYWSRVMPTLKWPLKTTSWRGFLETAKLSSAIREFVRMLMGYLKAYLNGGSWGIPSLANLKDILKLSPFGHSKCKRMKDVTTLVRDIREGRSIRESFWWTGGRKIRKVACEKGLHAANEKVC